MGWFNEQRSSRDTMYLPLNPEVVPDGGKSLTLEPGKHYLSITLRALRLASVTKGVGRFHEVVHSFSSLPSPSAENGTAEFHKIASPDKLKNLDASNIDLCRFVALRRSADRP